LKKYTTFLVLIIVINSFISCSSDSTEDLETTNIPDDKVTYTNNIKSIIDTNCISCHSSPPVNGAPIPLTTYSKVKEGTETGNVINRIERDQGSSGVMPPVGSTLSAAQIQLIKDWQTDGYLE